jgi:hypothetical protein
MGIEREADPASPIRFAPVNGINRPHRDSRLARL